MPIPAAALAALQRFMASNSPAAAASEGAGEPEDDDYQTGGGFLAHACLCLTCLPKFTP